MCLGPQRLEVGLGHHNKLPGKLLNSAWHDKGCGRLYPGGLAPWDAPHSLNRKCGMLLGVTTSKSMSRFLAHKVSIRCVVIALPAFVFQCTREAPSSQMQTYSPLASGHAFMQCVLLDALSKVPQTSYLTATLPSFGSAVSPASPPKA